MPSIAVMFAAALAVLMLATCAPKIETEAKVELNDITVHQPLP